MNLKYFLSGDNVKTEIKVINSKPTGPKLLLVRSFAYDEEPCPAPSSVLSVNPSVQLLLAFA